MMSKRGRTAFTAIAGALLALMLAPALASACLYPTLGLSVPAAGPGDPVPYTVVDAQPGAAYTLTVGGHVVASGTSSSAAGHSGSFQMPDLGSSQRVSVELEASHAGPDEPGHETGPWRDSKPLDFEVPVSAAAPAQQTASTQASAQPAAASAAEPSAPAARPALNAAAQSPRAARPAQVRERVSNKATRQASRGASPPRSARTPASALAQPATAAVVAVRADRGARSAPRSTSRSRALDRAAAPDAVARSAPAAASGRIASRGSDSGPDALLLAGLALILGAFVHGGCALARLRGPAGAPLPQVVLTPAVEDAAPADASAIEAELQRILTEAASVDPAGEREPAKTTA